MPAQKKKSPAARKAAQVAEDTRLIKQAKVLLTSENVNTSANGTKILIPFMQKPTGGYYIMETERRSRRQTVMKWRKLNDQS